MNCKQGDLAFIVRATNPENIGKIVEVVRPYVVGDEFFPIEGRPAWRLHEDAFKGAFVWVIRSHGAPLAWTAAGTKEVSLFKERPFADDCLRPIPRLDAPEEITTDEELTV
jgi:hypothetical protein